MEFHIHHIIPKHMGGTDESSNLIKLTIKEHAEAHKKLYEQYGLIQDKIAYEALNGQIGQQEARIKACVAACKDVPKSQETKNKISESLKGSIPWNKGKTGIYSQETIQSNKQKHLNKKHSQETKEKISLINKGRVSGMKNKNQKEESKIKISKSLIGNKRTMGMKWYHNIKLKKSILCHEGKQPNNYILGRLPKSIDNNI
jgi:hypothetical protein